MFRLCAKVRLLFTKEREDDTTSSSVENLRSERIRKASETLHTHRKGSGLLRASTVTNAFCGGAVAADSVRVSVKSLWSDRCG